MTPSSLKLPASLLASALTAGQVEAFYFPSVVLVAPPSPLPETIRPGAQSPQVLDLVPPTELLTPPASPMDPPLDPPMDSPLDPPATGGESPQAPPEVPEPATVTLAIVGVAAVVVKRRRGAKA